MSSPFSQSIPDADAFLAAVVESTDDAIISENLDGIIVTWNRAAERIYGYTAQEVIGRPVALLLPPERLDEENQILDRIRQGQRVDHYETTRRRKDGSYVQISLTASPIRSQDGRILGASKIARDILEQMRAQEQLRRSEERLRVTLASIGDGVISTDTRGRVTFLNSIAERLTGWTQRDAMSELLDRVFHIVHEDSGASVESPANRVLREGRIVGLANHTILISRDGTRRPIEDSGAPIFDRNGELIGVVLVFRDATEQRRAELAALRLASIISNSGDAIVGKDLRGIVTDWNPGAERIFGYRAEEMIGQSITKLIPPDRLEEEQCILASLQRGELVNHFESVRVRKDGEPIDVSLRISPIKDREGRIIGASKIARDVTEQKRALRELELAQQQLELYARDLEDRVRERTAELEATVAELEAFSYSLSHDMRAPLRAIRSFTDIVIADHGAQIGPAGVARLNKVTSAATRMDRLIQDMLSFASVSRQEILLEPIDVERLVRDIIAERPELQPPQVQIAIDSPLLSVAAHESLLTQCLTNLLDNAVKFVAPNVAPLIRVRTEPAGDQVRLWIEDNGIGITEQGQRKLFGMFQRVHAGNTYAGTGMGLAIVRQAAKRMNGSVGVESEPGQGSRFWVQLPAAK